MQPRTPEAHLVANLKVKIGHLVQEAVKLSLEKELAEQQAKVAEQQRAIAMKALADLDTMYRSFSAESAEEICELRKDEARLWAFLESKGIASEAVEWIRQCTANSIHPIPF